jgi:hypothetical protein
VFLPEEVGIIFAFEGTAVVTNDERLMAQLITFSFSTRTSTRVCARMERKRDERIFSIKQRTLHNPPTLCSEPYILIAT